MPKLNPRQKLTQVQEKLTKAELIKDKAILRYNSLKEEEQSLIIEQKSKIIEQVITPENAKALLELGMITQEQFNDLI